MKVESEEYRDIALLTRDPETVRAWIGPFLQERFDCLRQLTVASAADAVATSHYLEELELVRDLLTKLEPIWKERQPVGIARLLRLRVKHCSGLIDQLRGRCAQFSGEEGAA